MIVWVGKLKLDLGSAERVPAPLIISAVDWG